MLANAHTMKTMYFLFERRARVLFLLRNFRILLRKRVLTFLLTCQWRFKFLLKLFRMYSVQKIVTNGQIWRRYCQKNTATVESISENKSSSDTSEVKKLSRELTLETAPLFIRKRAISKTYQTILYILPHRHKSSFKNLFLRLYLLFFALRYLTKNLNN